MANPFGYPLSRLIRQRSYAAGELGSLEADLAAASATLSAARITHRALQREQQLVIRQLAELDMKIEEQSAIQVQDIRACKATPKRIKCRRGSIVSELVALLKAAGEPLSTSVVVDHMVRKFGLPTATPQDRRYTRKWTTCKLQGLVRRNAVKRLHDPTDNLTGLWLWIGL
jgi:hypothetical protein